MLPYATFCHDTEQLLKQDRQYANFDHFTPTSPILQNKLIERALLAHREGVISYRELVNCVESWYGETRQHGETAEQIIAYFSGRKTAGWQPRDAALTEGEAASLLAQIGRPYTYPPGSRSVFAPPDLTTSVRPSVPVAPPPAAATSSPSTAHVQAMLPGFEGYQPTKQRRKRL